MNKFNLSFVFIGIVIFSLSSGIRDENSNYSIQEVKKVLNLIRRIQNENAFSEKHGSNLRTVEVTESELNSYIAYRIDTENEEILKDLRLKLFKGNKIEGKIFIDLKKQNVLKILRPQMNIFFGAKVQNKENMIKIDVNDLFIEGQRVQPILLDFIILVASKIEGVEAWSLNDWIELPYGIKDVKIAKGKAVFYY